MSALVDYYDVLGVPRHATSQALLEAYRRKARACHPDLHPEDPLATTKFKQLNEAFDTLKDAEKRRKYDQLWQREVAARAARQGTGKVIPPPLYKKAPNSSSIADLFREV